MKKDKTKLILGITVLGLVFLTMGLFLFVQTKHDVDYKDLILIIPVILVIILVIPILFRNYKSIKEKTPFEDERSLKAKTKAAATSFYISIYLLLAIVWFGEPFFERPSQAVGAGIMGMSIVFLVSWFYFEKKSNL